MHVYVSNTIWILSLGCHVAATFGVFVDDDHKKLHLRYSADSSSCTTTELSVFLTSLTLVEYSSDQQRLWSDCIYAQADLRPCWSHIPHCWKSHVTAQL